MVIVLTKMHDTPSSKGLKKYKHKFNYQKTKRQMDKESEIICSILIWYET